MSSAPASRRLAVSIDFAYCNFRCYEERVLLKHMRTVHSNDPRFCVRCSICGKTFRKWPSLKKHLHREHGSKSDFSIEYS